MLRRLDSKWTGLFEARTKAYVVRWGGREVCCGLEWFNCVFLVLGVPLWRRSGPLRGEGWQEAIPSPCTTCYAVMMPPPIGHLTWT